ncbi:ribonuclease E/G [Lachnotalea sp. AF33-28]|nr:ribonuclease E/G [Lachnotalea sp. AF33-28]
MLWEKTGNGLRWKRWVKSLNNTVRDNKLIITRRDSRIMTAVLESGRIMELIFDQEKAGPQVGDVYIGKVKNIVGNISAAFIEIGQGCICYCPLEEIPAGTVSRGGRRIGAGEWSDGGYKLCAGDELPVQVVREAVKTKAPVVSGRINLSGRYAVLIYGGNQIHFSSKIKNTHWKDKIRSAFQPVLPEGCGAIIRTNAFEAEEEDIRQDLEGLTNRMDQILQSSLCRTCYSCVYESLPAYLTTARDLQKGFEAEIVTDDAGIYRALADAAAKGIISCSVRLYEDESYPLSKLYSLDTVIREALAKNVWLKSGGYLVVEPTEALTVIDVNTGKFDGRKKQQETFLKINLEAAEEAARQMRLRNISGIVLIDFIDMEREEDKRKLMDALTAWTRKDRIKTTVVDMTGLNLVEITRKRERKPLWEQAAVN